MNFFESQDRVRRHTVLLVALFVVAVLALIIMTNLLVMIVFGYTSSEQLRDSGTFLEQLDWPTFAAVSAGVVTVVAAGSLYKILALSGGGKVVAESLGGQLIPQDTQDPNQRKLLNVVQEMAIASGTPAPPVYLLAKEQGINSFAAGLTPRDAVLGITQGAIEHLTREQLQGVIAHEFSHIFNGDMRLNLRLIGVLNGILILGILGYYLLYSSSFSRGRRNNSQGAAAMLALAIGLIVIGFTGTFFGGLIKAAVSRQREYLADATAVQFTRNPEGIAGALKRIGGLKSGSKLDNPSAAEVSHAFFAQGVAGFMQGLAATHPPLAKRILRIDSQWDGKFDTSDTSDPPRQNGEEVNDQETVTYGQHADKTNLFVAGAAIADVVNAIDQIGNPQPDTIAHARSMISELPAAIREAASEPYGARTVIYCLMLNSSRTTVRDQQLAHLQAHADQNVFALIQKLQPELDGLSIKFRLPLISIAIPALKQLSLDQYQAFRGNLAALIAVDSRIDLLDWSLQKILVNHLDGQFLKQARTTTRYSQLSQLKKDTELILSVLAYAGQQDQLEVEAAFSAAEQTLDIGKLQLTAQNAIQIVDLDRALQALEKLSPLAKPQLLKACAASIVRDRKVAAVEFELLRAFADVLGCPMPPLVLSPQLAAGKTAKTIKSSL